jgi:glycosyltransferase involved in cell wall biosynthesis
LTIFGRNNTQNDRYIKNLKSVLIQNYTNYHIVLLDDVSDDGTLEKSADYLLSNGFPKDRLKVVRNKKRNFATYNIINSAHTFC